uniref:Uncharacterized protein n=1 Tax=Aegilops tauschii subsp. strangulata TaxID=200361 RepID=A0A453CXF3_AEGTS
MKSNPFFLITGAYLYRRLCNMKKHSCLSKNRFILTSTA